jgi:D-beta-D-heptose 7-phosphate kinase/D-beta-D-heptose 1-phosphate adenosyltransferase
VFVDPKGRNYYKYANATMIFPNRAEIAVATGTTPDDLQILFQKAELLRASVGVISLAVTMGELGISVVAAGHVRRYPAQVREVFDVSGAGDTVIATWAAAFAAGLDEQDCACLANLAAGNVIGRVGTVPISRDDLSVCLSRESFNQSTGKICTLEQLQSTVTLWRAQSERVVFTNGCFDLLHVGHVTLLERAKREGSRLVVGLNSDRSVRALKGANRPVMGESDRASLLASMSSVDAVTIFHEETPLEIIRAIKPDVLVKGGDYTEDQVVGAAEVRSWGGRVALVPLVEGRSTTKLLGRLRHVADVQQGN